ncbi:TRP-domain-containing protein [Xylariaceae sp. FL0255]|nr:TRP-domain-containing protein [Xylariaceae sp. FL0255]
MASFTTWTRTPLVFLFYLTAISLPTTCAEKILKTDSLASCQQSSQFTASLFDLTYTPSSGEADINITAVSTVDANVEFWIQIFVYGYEFYTTTINPCDLKLDGFCPMTAGNLNTPLSFSVPPSAATQIPGIAYTFPDLDAKVRVYINATSGSFSGTSVACLEAAVSNSKTVNLLGVKWASAIVAGLALASSALLSGLGHANAASHVAATALALTSYFQSQALIGLVAVTLPPAVQAWTQDFLWSLGIVDVGFLQKIYTWYQRSTGGTASQILDTLYTVSVQIQKRSLLENASSLFKRSGNIQTSYGDYVVYGIQRAAFQANIETTNLFLTGIISFYIVMVLTTIFVALFKVFCEFAAKARLIKGDTFADFRHGWLTVLRGILLRITLIGYAPVTVLCLWEFTQDDSPAEVLLAVYFLLYVNIALGWAAFKVIKIAHRSVALHRNPAYILFSDPQTLNKWGFIYIQFRASAYYFIVPTLGHMLLKSFFIGLAQKSGTTQAIALFLIEAAALIAASVLRPWMDKKTNSFYITICAVNFINAIFLLIFTNVFSQPQIVNGVIGVVLWILNAVTTTVLLFMLIISTVLVFFRENPDGRYKFMADDRASFMKSQSQITATGELDALGATARGEKHGGYGSGVDLEDDAESFQKPGSVFRPQSRPQSFARPSAGTGSSSSTMHDQGRPSTDQRAPFLNDGHNISRTGSPVHPARAQHNASPWQRGAGYEA